MSKSDDKPGMNSPFPGMDWGSYYGMPSPDYSSASVGNDWQIPFKPDAYMPAYLRFYNEQQKIHAGISKVEATKGDKRFQDEAWHSNPIYRNNMQSYLAYCQFLQEWLDASELKGVEKIRAQFRLDTMMAALSPSNNLHTNPEAMQRYMETGGASYTQGMSNYKRDQAENKGMPSQVDTSKFKVGENLATLAGEVVFRNELMELIQYSAATDQVYAKPMLVCTSVVNKFYLCDLVPEGSLYRYLVEQGFQVFITSWRNPTPEQGHWGLDHYVDALLEALAAVADISGDPRPNLTGFCAGSYISLCALGYLQAKNREAVDTHTIILNSIEHEAEDSLYSAMTTPEDVKATRERVTEQGVFTADELTFTFNYMQPDKLFWPYFVKNYLLGEEPEDVELMFWMNDQVNMPAKLFLDFLDISQDNALTNGDIKIHDVKIDLSTIKAETFILGALKDHVVSWQAVYRTRKHLGGPTTFVLSTGGHVTGMITAADDPREACYTSADNTANAEQWLTDATKNDFSWRRAWTDMLAGKSGEKIDAPNEPGNAKHSPLAPAPGTYVRE